MRVESATVLRIDYPFKLLVVLAVANSACSIVTPPPVVAAHDLAAAKPKGTISATIVLGFGAGVFVNSGYGLELRLGHQVHEKVEVGIGLAVAKPVSSRAALKQSSGAAYDKCSARAAARARPATGHPGMFAGVDTCSLLRPPHIPDVLFAAHLFFRVNPDVQKQWYAVTGGLGFGFTDTGMNYITTDIGVRFATSDGGVDTYAQPTIAVSWPISKGRPADKTRSVHRNSWYGISAGIIGISDDQSAASADVTILVGEAMLLLVSGAATIRD